MSSVRHLQTGKSGWTKEESIDCATHSSCHSQSVNLTQPLLFLDACFRGFDASGVCGVTIVAVVLR